MSHTETEDLELRAREDHHASLRLWLRLLSCTTLVEDNIRQKLRTQFDTSLSRFDLMAQLERHPEGLTMGELSRRMMVSGGQHHGDRRPVRKRATGGTAYCSHGPAVLPRLVDTFWAPSFQAHGLRP